MRGEEEGPAIYLVAGVHGDETAGWMAGNLLLVQRLTNDRIAQVVPLPLVYPGLVQVQHQVRGLIPDILKDSGGHLLGVPALGISRKIGGALCASPITLYGSPPPGSVNRVVTLELGIPVITVETCREESLAQRVRNQLELVEFVLMYYGLR